jgi:hypothetical protein
MRLTLALIVLLAATAASAQRQSPEPSAATATTETLSAILATDGWCLATNGTSTLNLSGSAPSRVTDAIKNRVRFVSIRFVGGASSTRVCHRIGGSLQSSACASLGSNAVGVLTDGQSATYAVARDRVQGGLPAIEAQANAGTDGAVCVVIGW